LVAFVTLSLVAVNLSTDDKPKQPNANKATEFTNTGDGATSSVEKEL
jgi:hypothetical protein